MQNNDGFKPLYSEQLSPEKWALREKVVDATFRQLLVGTELSSAIILDIDANIVCRYCKHFVIVFEVTCESNTEKQCAITLNFAKILSKYVGPTGAFVLQIHDYNNHHKNLTPKHLTLYPIYLPPVLSNQNLSSTIHLTYEQFQKLVIWIYKTLHPPEVCETIKHKNIYVYARKVVLVAKWEGDENEAASCQNFRNSCSS
jgi:hypothetical protein